MLAPPAGETFDSLDGDKLPTRAPVSDPAHEYVPLLEPEVPETTESDSSVRRKVKKSLLVFNFNRPVWHCSLC